MVVTCDHCKAQYNLKTDKIPKSGARIKCPKCQQYFVIRPPKMPSFGELPSVASEEHIQRRIQEKVHSGLIKIAKTPHTAAFTPLNMSREEMIKALNLEPDQVAKLDENLTSSEEMDWRIKLAGAIYRFSSTPQMQAWLEDRERLDNIFISKDQGEWIPLSDMQEVLTPSMREKLQPKTDLFGSQGSGLLNPNANPLTASPFSKRTADKKITLADMAAVQVPVKSAKKRFIPPTSKKASNNLIKWITVLILVLTLAVIMHLLKWINLGYVFPFLKEPPKAERIVAVPIEEPELTSVPLEEPEVPPVEVQPQTFNPPPKFEVKVEEHKETPEEKAVRLAKSFETVQALLSQGGIENAARARAILDTTLLSEEPENIDYLKAYIQAHKLLHRDTKKLEIKLKGLEKAREREMVVEAAQAKDWETVIELIGSKSTKIRDLEMLRALEQAYRETGAKLKAKRIQNRIKLLGGAP